MSTTVIGFLGTNLDDGGKGAKRWEKWRPTVAICQQEHMLVGRLDLMHDRRAKRLAEEVAADVGVVSPETQVVLHEVEIRNPWDFEEMYEALFAFAKRYEWRDEDEYLVHITTGTHVAQICLFLLTESRWLPGKLLQSSPTRERGVGKVEVIDLDLSRYDRIATRSQEVRQEAASFLKGGIETRNAAFNRLIDRIEQVAVATKDPLLLMGPTGAGKSRLARRIFELKKLRHAVKGEFVDVNCATLRGDGAMSALFGHRKGAFTGALTDRAGYLRTADGGMLFLDEIGELGLDEQAMLLRALEEKTFLPLGSDKATSSDFQLIAGTNKDLGMAVREGRFREDLLARINLWTFTLPGLKQRLEDVEPNLSFELDQFARRTGRQVSFSKEAREKFLKFASAPRAEWRGNFRDLNAAVARMATLAMGGRISVEIVEEEIARLEATWWRREEGGELLVEVMGDQAVEELDLFDRVQLETVIRVCREARTMSEAGRALFGASRSRKASTNDADRLRKYLTRFGLEWAKITKWQSI
jgi:transcriptional regulatory protein RtcR